MQQKNASHIFVYVFAIEIPENIFRKFMTKKAEFLNSGTYAL